jgi:hypothetical protein
MLGFENLFARLARQATFLGPDGVRIIGNKF